MAPQLSRPWLHAAFVLLLVGYGTDINGVQYYKMKNSWGTSWGMAGYVLIARGETYNNGAGECGIYQDPSYPTM